MGVVVFAPAVIEPYPFSVHEIVPLLALAPLTVAVAPTQIVWLPPADAVGNAETFTSTSFDTIADPHVGVMVHTTYQLPEPNEAPVGVYVEVETPKDVIAPPELDRFPHR